MSPIEEKIWAPLGHLTWFPCVWQAAASTSCSESPTFVRSASLASGGLSSLIQETLSPLPFFPFPLLKSLYFSVLSYFCPVILRVWSSGSSHLSLWDLLPLAGNGSPWRVTREVGEALLIPCRPWPSGLPADQRFMRVIEVKAHYVWWLEVWSSLYSHLHFLLPRGVLEVMGWSSRFLYTGVQVGERPTCGLQSHTGWTTVCFPGLITLVGSGQGASPFTDPFWKPAGWCLNRHLQGVGWNGSLSLSVSFSFSVFLSLLPLSLPWSSPLHSCPLYPENPWLCFQVLSLVSLWCSFVWPTAPASLCRYCGHSGALKPWNTNKPTLPESWALGYLLGF